MQIIYISDNNEYLWNTGIADKIMQTCKWWNCTGGFKANVPAEVIDEIAKICSFGKK